MGEKTEPATLFQQFYEFSRPCWTIPWLWGQGGLFKCT